MSNSKRLEKRFRREHRPKNKTWTAAATSPPPGPVAAPDEFLFKEGRPMAILRPENPALKLRRFEQPNMTQAMMDAALREQPHQFVGYATRTSRIVDCAGRTVGMFEPGDSFVGADVDAGVFRPPDFMLTGVVHKETWGSRVVVVLPRPNLKVDSNTGVVVESSDPSEVGAIALRGGAPAVDCHIPALNRIITGDPDVDYRTACKPELIN